MCLPHLQRKHNSCSSRRNSPHPPRMRHYTQHWGGRRNRGARLWSEGLSQACEPTSGLTGSERCIRRTVCANTMVRRGDVASMEASGQALSSTGETGRARHMPGGPQRWMATEGSRRLLQTL